MIIYGLCDSGEPGVIRYVGKSIDPKKRLRQHLGRLHGSSHKVNWMRSVLADGRMIIQVFIAFAATDADADRLERHYIALFYSLGVDLTNATDGGDGQSPGYAWSDEARRKASASHMGTKRSPESIKKTADGNRGKPFSAERCAKISAANLGRKLKQPRSAEYRAKLSAALKGKPKPCMIERNKARDWTPERRAAQGVAQRLRWATKRELEAMPAKGSVS